MRKIRKTFLISSLVLFIGIFISASSIISASSFSTSTNPIIVSYLTVDATTKATHAAGAYKVDLSTNQIEFMVMDGGKVESASPDGNYLLVCYHSQLFVTDLNGNHISLVSNTYNGDSEFKQAYFLPDSSRAIFIAQDSNSSIKGIYSSDLKGTNSLQISKPGSNPLVLFPSFGTVGVNWLKGTLDENGIPTLSGQKFTSMAGKETTIYWRGPTIWTLFSPDNTHVAFLPKMIFSTKNILNITDLNGMNKIDLVGPKSPDKEMRDIYLTGKYWAYPLNWSPDGTRILVRIYRQNNGTDEYYVFDVSGNVLYRRLPITWTTAWSPDGSQIAYFDGNLNIYDIPSGSVLKVVPGLPNGRNLTLYWIGNKQQ